MSYLSLKETSAILGLSTDTVRRKFICGEIKCFKIGKVWRTTIENIEAYLQTCTVVKGENND